MPAWPLDRRLTAWIVTLAGIAAANLGLWISMARSPSLHTPYAETQLLLSGIYVAVCCFRSLFPRVDLERVCLWDTWLSGIMLGRSAATLAELCFALQCSLFVGRLADVAGMPALAVAAYAFLPMAVLAQILCWYAVLSLNHFGHAIEESLWAVMFLMLSAASGAAATAVDGPLRTMLFAGCLVYGVGAILTMTVDVGMYVRRWRAGHAGSRLTLASGLRDSRLRRQPTSSWQVWREEAPWMTLYFSVGVWTSLAFVLLK